MKQELTERLKQSAHNILDKLENGADWTVEQIPQVANEYLTWVFYDNLITASILLLVIVIAYCPAVYIENRVEETNKGLYTFCITVISIMLMFVVVSKAKICIKVKVAPKLLLLEKLAELAR